MCAFASVSVFHADKVQRVEAHNILEAMLEFEQNSDPAQMALVAHCLAMLWFLEGDSLKVSHLTRNTRDTVPRRPPPAMLPLGEGRARDWIIPNW